MKLLLKTDVKISVVEPDLDSDPPRLEVMPYTDPELISDPNLLLK